MKALLKIVFFLFLIQIANGQSQPAGVPTVNSPSGFYNIGWLKSLNGIIPGSRDTNFVARYGGTLLYRPTDGRLYYFDSTNLSWRKLSTGSDEPINIATSSLMATGNWQQNWDNKQLIFNKISTLGLFTTNLINGTSYRQANVGTVGSQGITMEAYPYDSLSSMVGQISKISIGKQGTNEEGVSLQTQDILGSGATASVYNNRFSYNINSDSIYFSPGEQSIIGINPSNDLYFQLGGQPRVIFQSNGFVGVGSQPPLEMLDVNGNIQSRDAFIIYNPLASTLRGELYNKGNALGLRTITSHPLSIETNDTERARFTSDGVFNVFAKTNLLDTSTAPVMSDADSSNRIETTGRTKRLINQLAASRPLDSVLGVIYQAFSFVNLNDFVNRGATASVSSGNINFSGGTNTLNQTLEYSRATLLEKWHESAVFIPTEKTATSYGFGLGIRSINTTPVNVISKFDASTGVNSGKLFIYAGTSNTLVKTSETAIAFNANDTLEMHMERVIDSISVWIINRTQRIVSPKLTYGYSYTTSGQLNQNTGRFAIYSMGGTFSVTSLTITSNTMKYADVAVEGDSKSAGYYLSSPYLRWAVQVRKPFPNLILQAGSADKITDAQQRLAETLSLVPKQFLLCIGVNDIRAGVDSSTIKLNYTNYVSALEASGAKVFHILSIKEAVLNADWFNNFIIRTWPNSYIDSETQFCDNCLSPDGVHPNDKGNTMIADAVLQSEYLQGFSSVEDNSLNSVLAKGFTSNISPIIGSVPRLGGNLGGTFSDPKLYLTGTYPSISFETNRANFGGGTVLFKTDGGGPKVNPALFGDGVGMALVAQVYDNTTRTFAIFTADNTNNQITGFAVRQAASDFLGTRSRVTAQAGQNLYAGFELPGAPSFNTPAVFAVYSANNPIDLYSLPVRPYDSTYKLVVNNPTNGQTIAMNWPKQIPTLTAGSVVFSDGTNLAQNNANLFWDNANVRLGLGTNTPVASSLLDMTSTTKGLLTPRMNTAQQNAIASPATGLLIYNLDSLKFRQYNGGSWETIGGSGGSGGSGTVTNFSFTDGNGFDGTVINSTTTPTLSLTTTLTTASIPFIGASGALSQDNTNFNFDNTNKRVSITAGVSPLSKLHINSDALGGNAMLASLISSGILLSNTTAAANNSQQASPYITFRANGWGTTAGTSQTVDWRIGQLPVQGATPTSNFLIGFSNGGAFNSAVSISAGGTITAGSYVASTSLTAGSTGQFNWSSRSAISSPANGSILLSNSAVTDFSLLQFGGSTASFPAFQRNGINLIARLADNSANTDLEVLDETYGVSWDGSNEVPTKNAIYDKIENVGTTIYSGDGSIGGNRTITSTGAFNMTFDNFNFFNLNGTSTLLRFSTTGALVAQGIFKKPITNSLAIGPVYGGAFNKGAVEIDTNTNLLVGGAAIDFPLYTTGNSLYVATGLQSRSGNFYKSRNVTSTGNALLTDYWITIDASGGSVTITLPAASSAYGGTMGIQYVFNRIDNVLGNTVTIQRAGSDTINGVNTFTLDSQWQVKEVQCTSTSTWNIK